MNDFYLTSSIDIDCSSPRTPVCQVKSECEFALYDYESHMGVIDPSDQKNGKEDTKDEVRQFVEGQTGKFCNKNDLSLKDNCINADRPSSHTSVCHVKPEYDLLPSNGNSDIKDESPDEENESDIKEEVLQFTDERAGKIWNREDASYMKDCVKQTSEEIEGSTSKIYLETSSQESYRTADVNSVHLQNAKSHKCYICDYSARRKGNLKVHINSVHLRVKFHKCHLCDYSASRKDTLKVHITGFHLHMQPHKCHLCDYRASKKRDLQVHVSRVHLKENPHKCYLCHLCEYRASRKRDLNDHVAAIHLKEKPHKCHLCDYRATKKCGLTAHITGVHLKEKPHKCQLCDYRARVKSVLEAHVAAVHRKERPHKCHLCNYSSYQKNDLKVHIVRIHMKEKPYKCHLCGHYTTTQCKLRKHIASSH